MKSFLKYLLVSCLLILSLFILIYNIYKGHVIDNLKSGKTNVDSKWSELFENSRKRVDLIKELNSKIESKGFKIDSLNIVIEDNYKTRNIYKNECSLDFVELEFVLNKQFVKLLSKLKNDSILNDTEKSELLIPLKENQNIINKNIDDYNGTVLDYNKYIALFPNFIIAKGRGFYKKKYFTIRYGIENEDPIVKSQQLPEWAKGVDTL